HQLSLPYVAPCVNRSDAAFMVRDGALHYALGALKNVGVEAMRLITTGRGDKPFATLFDFARRVDLKRIGKRPLEMLARSGAFDELDRNRRRVFDSVDKLMAYSAAIHEQKSSAQVSLFGEAGEDLPEPRLSPVEDWLPAERLREEFLAVGFYFSGHPLDDYEGALKRKDVKSLHQVESQARRAPSVMKIAGVVAGRQERRSARGNRFAFVQLSDMTGSYEVTMFSDTLEAAREHLEPGSMVVIGVEATMEEDQLKLLGRSVSPIDTVVSDAGQSGLKIFIEDEEVLTSVARVLEDAANAKGGRGPISFCLMDPDLPGEVEMTVPGLFPVSPQIRGALRSLGGVVTVEEV
ncbi:MAG: OB-fold nucleic acid binding domain-containing protein, partial [Pseudomonadota bacterium]